MTQFQQAVAQAELGQLQTPTVSYGSKKVNYFGYQLATHHFNLKLMAKGLKFGGIKLKDLKDYYGLKGRTAAACLSQFEYILESYQSRFQNN